MFTGNVMSKKKKVIEMSETEIINEYRKIIGERDFVSSDSVYDEYGNFKKVSFLKQADVHYLVNSCDLVEV